jgi:hypothetical protein
LKNTSQVSSYWPYAHDRFEDEIFTKNSQDWDEFIARMVDPNITKFKSMILDEKMTILEQTVQGALRSREETIMAETTKIPLVAPIQERNSPKA